MVRKLSLLASLPLLLGAGSLGFGRAEKGVPRREIPPSEGCRECHAFPAGTSHPLGGKPWFPVDLPLEGGTVGCLTCHDGRVLSPGHTEVRGNAFLRKDREGLCRTCHKPGPSTRGRLVHGLSGGRAHMVRKGNPSGPAGGGRLLDEESRRCLSCHDGSLTKGGTMGKGGSTAWERLRENHPVGVAYDPALRKRGKYAFRPVGFLPEAVDLPGGRVGCASCHGFYNRNPHLLVIPNRGSRLCLSCHVK